jgi:hypothetical protein
VVLAGEWLNPHQCVDIAFHLVICCNIRERERGGEGGEGERERGEERGGGRGGRGRRGIEGQRVWRVRRGRVPFSSSSVLPFI